MRWRGILRSLRIQNFLDVVLIQPEAAFSEHLAIRERIEIEHVFAVRAHVDDPVIRMTDDTAHITFRQLLNRLFPHWLDRIDVGSRHVPEECTPEYHASVGLRLEDDEEELPF